MDAAIDRRAVLALTGAAAGFVTVARPFQAGSATEPPIRYVVTDRRYAESLEFGEALVKHGAARLELTEGLTEIWRRVLAPHWRSRPGGVAGMTAPAAWLGLAEQARGEGRRSALIGRHMIGPQAGAAAHVVTVPRATLAACAGMECGPGRWPTAMAGLAVRCSSAPRERDGEWRSQAPLHPSATRYSLVSWIIA